MVIKTKKSKNSSNETDHQLASTSAPTTSDTSQNKDDFDLVGLSEELRLMVKVITARFNKRFDEKDEQIAKLEEIVGTLCGRLEKQSEIIEKQGEIIERLQQEKIKDVMIMSGSVPTFRANEDCAEVVAKTLREKLMTNIRSSDIVGAARLGAPKQGDIIDRRPIKFKFKQGNIDHRKNIQIACATVKPSVYINEQMTSFKKDLFNKVRIIKRDAPGVIKSCYVSNGRVVIKNPDGRNIKLINQKELDRYLQEFNITVPNQTQ